MFLCCLQLLTDGGYLILARLKLLSQVQIFADHSVLRGLKTLNKLHIVLSDLVLRRLEMAGEVRIVAGQLYLAGFELLNSLLQVRKFARDRLTPLRQFGNDRSRCWTRALSVVLSLN